MGFRATLNFRKFSKIFETGLSNENLLFCFRKFSKTEQEPRPILALLGKRSPGNKFPPRFEMDITSPNICLLSNHKTGFHVNLKLKLSLLPDMISICHVTLLSNLSPHCRLRRDCYEENQEWQRHVRLTLRVCSTSPHGRRL